jgi:hypothetical protein
MIGAIILTTLVQSLIALSLSYQYPSHIVPIVTSVCFPKIMFDLVSCTLLFVNKQLYVDRCG